MCGSFITPPKQYNAVFSIKPHLGIIHHQTCTAANISFNKTLLQHATHIDQMGKRQTKKLPNQAQTTNISFVGDKISDTPCTQAHLH